MRIVLKNRFGLIKIPFESNYNYLKKQIVTKKMIQKGTIVKWKWGNGMAEGKVVETYTDKITKTIKGTEVSRNGEQGNKALYIRQEDGDHVLKSEEEVERVE